MNIYSARRKTKNMLKKFLCIVLSLCILATLSSCGKSNNVFYDEDYSAQENELTVSPYFAYYNNGKEVELLKEIDPEIAKEGVKEDGAFNIYFAVCNNSSFDRKITEISVDFIRVSPVENDYDADKAAQYGDIVVPSIFDMDEETYIASGQTLIIPCTFEKDFVLLEAKLDELYTKATVSYEGCVLQAKTHNYQKHRVNYFVDELKFTSTNGIEGVFSIVNESEKDEYFGTVKINFYTSKGEKINKQPLTMEINSTVKSTEKLTLRYAIFPDNVEEKIAENKLFDLVDIEIIKE